MDIIQTFSIVFATLMLVVAVMNKMKSHRLLDELNEMESRVEEAEKQTQLLQRSFSESTKARAVSEATVLSIAGEIARMENNLQHMGDVPGRKQLAKALERMKGALQAEDYTIVPLLGHPYVEGMNARVVFVPDESLKEGISVIQSVQKPQVNYRGKMVQAASITVGQNIK